MNVKQWGPSGWILLHKAAEQYEPQLDNAHYRKLYCTLGDVLPCKYCRESYSTFVRQLPIDMWLQNNRDLSFFVYQLHNKVNEKLRLQGHNENGSDPYFDDVFARFRAMDCRFAMDNSWKFLYAIAFNYPVCDGTDRFDAAKQKAYIDFFTAVTHTFPCKEIRKEMQEYARQYPIGSNLDTRNQCIVWLYRMQSAVHTSMGMEIPAFDVLFTEIESMRAKCGNNTCRTPFYVK